MPGTELEDAVDRNLDRRADDRLHSAIALLVALTATFMAVCNIKDGNIVQAMSVARSKAVDTWAHYQAKSLKQALALGSIDQMELTLGTSDTLRADMRTRVEARLKDAREKVTRYEAEKDELKARAEAFEKEYERLNESDDEFDVAEACLSLALALYGITALTRRRRLLWLSVAISLWGGVQGVAGFAGVSVRPAWLARLLN